MEKPKIKYWSIILLILLLLLGLHGCHTNNNQQEARDNQTDDNGVQEKDDSEVIEAIVNTKSTCSITNNESDVLQITDDQASSNMEASKTTSAKSSTTLSSNVDIAIPSQPIHEHTWVAITEEVVHEEIGHYENQMIKSASVEQIPIYEYTYYMVCNQCGHIMYNGDIDAHYKSNFDCSSWRDECTTELVGYDIIEHEAEFERVWVVDQPAWIENVIIGYKCECGKTK